MERFTIFEYIFSAILTFVSVTTVIPYSFYITQRTFLFLCIFLLVFLLTPLGQASTFGALLIICFLITIISRPRLLSLCCSLWGYLCGVIINYFCLLIADTVFSLSIAELSESYSIPFIMINIILVYGILRCFRYLIQKKWSLVSFNFPPRILTSCFFCLLVCCIIFITNFTYGETIGYPSFIIRLNALLFTAFFVLAGLLLFFIIQEVLRNQEYQKRLEYLSIAQESSAALDFSYQELRKFKHDYHNVLCVLSSYIEAGDLSGIRQYFHNSLFPFYQQMSEFSPKFALDTLNIPEVKGLCLNKAYYAQSLGISVKLSVPTEISGIRMASVDFIRVLGIYFDNAIEAAKTSKEKSLEFSLSSDGNGTTLLLMNSFFNDALTLNHLSGSGYTSKGIHHGNGLGIVKDILKNYPEIEHHTCIRNHFVIQELKHL